MKPARQRQVFFVALFSVLCLWSASLRRDAATLEATRRDDTDTARALRQRIMLEQRSARR